MASTYLTTLQTHIRNTFTQLPPPQQKLIYTLLPVLLSTPLLYISLNDYRNWYTLGPSGVPQNAFGWLIQTLLRPLGKEPLSTSIYTAKSTITSSSPQGNQTHLTQESVPQREGQRPDIGNWIVPHRQLTTRATPDLKSKLQTYIRDFSTATTTNSGSLTIKTSHLERHGDALYLSSVPTKKRHPVAKWMGGEIVHMHEIDGSIHVALSAPDAKLVIERGWGQRHGLSGRGLWCGFLMVYAPRDEMELEVVETIVRASVDFMLAGVEGTKDESK